MPNARAIISDAIADCCPLLMLMLMPRRLMMPLTRFSHAVAGRRDYFAIRHATLFR